MKEIIQKVLRGDRNAYRAIVKEHGPAIRAFHAAHLSQPDVVDDLAQETFIAAFESLGQHGEALEKLKAEAAQKVFEETCQLQEGDDVRAVDRLRQCIEKLPPRLMTVVRARYFDRERVTSIAGKLGTTATAISSLLFRGRKELESCLGRSR